MTTDYIVASLPALDFGAPPPMTWRAFEELCGGDSAPVLMAIGAGRWADIDTQLRNAMAAARGAPEFRRPAKGCSLYWKKRVEDCFAEKDVARRQDMLDRTWWDAAGELADPANPLGEGALAAYAVRLRIAIRRASVSAEAGSAVFDRLTAETKDIL